MYNVLLHILKKKSSFYRYKNYIKEHTVPKEMIVILQSMDSYFKLNPTLKEIDFDSFITWFKLTKSASLSKEKHNFYDKTFNTLTTSSPTEEEINRTLEVLVETDYAVKISDHLIKITEGDTSKSVSEVEGMLREYKSESKKVTTLDQLFIEDDINDILDNHLRPGLDWRLGEMNRCLGPLRQGDFIIVTSRPDSGKTTFLCSEATYMAQQMKPEQEVIWFNNEETRQKVKQRIWQAALGWSKAQLSDNKLKTVAELEKALGRLDRIRVVDHKAMTVHHVEEALENSNPGLIIFDQLWKIQGFSEAFSEVDKMTKLFAWARGLADKYSPVINVHQADGSASGEQWIQMNQLYNSKTGIQGEADAIVGIGRTFDGPPNTRYLYASKNKLDGGPKSVDLERNYKYEIEIHPHIARFSGAY